MDIVVGLFGISLSVFFAAIVSITNRYLAVPLLAGLFFRLALMTVKFFDLFTLPGDGFDTVVFLRVADQMSALGWVDFWARFSISDASLYSWIGGLLFKLFVPSELLFQSLNLLLGLIGICLVYSIACRLWGPGRARIAAFAMALFPLSAFNSVLLLREEISITFFLLGLLFAVRWVGSKSLLHLALTSFGFGVASMFHAGWAAAFFGLAAIVFSELNLKGQSKFDAFSSIASVLFFLGIAVLVGTSDISLSKGIGKPFDFVSSRMGLAIEDRLGVKATGGSAYPAFVATGNAFSQPWLVPARLIYFLFSPFPWDIRSVRHLIGFVGSAAYFWLAVRIYNGRALIKQSRECRAVLIISGMTILAFALGTTNIGTSLRHRTKVFGALVAVAVGSIRR